MTKPRIDSEFKAWLRALTTEEYTELEQSILSEGCLDPLKVWEGQNILLDGHHRLQICEAHNIPYDTEEIMLPDREAALEWIDINQINHRTPTADELSLIWGRIYNRRKKAERTGGKGKERARGPQSEDHLRTAEQIAKERGVGHSTVERDGKFAEAVEKIKGEIPDIVDRIHAGSIPSRKAIIEAAKDPSTAEDKLSKPHVAHNSGENEWYTPAEYIAAAREVMGTIDLDPASSSIANQTVGATHYYTKEQDGLKRAWGGKMWMNPPYSASLIKAFASKYMESCNAETIEESIVLVNNATETGWFQQMVSVSSAIVFVTKRVKFLRPDGTTGAPLQGQAILYHGVNHERFLEVFADFGWGVIIWD